MNFAIIVGIKDWANWRFDDSNFYIKVASNGIWKRANLVYHSFMNLKKLILNEIVIIFYNVCFERNIKKQYNISHNVFLHVLEI